MGAPKVFISSTQTDLHEERDAAVAVTRELKLGVENMENWGASPDTPIIKCQTHLRQCNAVVLIVGFRYGSVCADTATSYTEAEYDDAVTHGKTLFVYLKDEKAYIQGISLDPTGVQFESVRRFREKVKVDRVVSTYRSVNELRGVLGNNLADWFKRPRPGSPPPPKRSRHPPGTIILDDMDGTVLAVDPSRLEHRLPTRLVAPELLKRRFDHGRGVRAWLGVRDELGRALRELFNAANREWKAGRREYEGVLAAALDLSGEALERLGRVPDEARFDPDVNKVANRLASIAPFARAAHLVLTREQSPTERDKGCKLVHQIIDWLLSALAFTDHLVGSQLAHDLFRN